MAETQKQITNEEVKQLVLERGLTTTQLIDVIIDLNHFLGVGCISLGNDLQKYCYSKSKK